MDNRWHHEHLFQLVDNGVLMTDKVTYELPLGILGEVIHKLVVRNQLKEIFAYRTKRIKNI